MPLPSLVLLVVLLPAAVLALSTTQPRAPMKYAYQPSAKSYLMRVTSLHRYAIKGLSGDALQHVRLEGGDGTFEDDRRFALLYDTSGGRFDGEDPEWLHKDNFLCAFTAPELLATLDTEYRVVRDDDVDAKRLLTVWDRARGRSSPPLLGPTDLSLERGMDETAAFFSELCGKKVRCVVANKGSGAKLLAGKHTHQFGNTSSGVKNNDGDTRTIHIVNRNTVAQLSEAVYGADGIQSLSCTRFRPNVVVDGLEPWAEFDLVGKFIEVVPTEHSNDNDDPPLRFRITSRTVRCAGVGVDPLHPELGTIDIPDLLVKHFPEHGPYLGVYAVVDDPERRGGTMSVGDTFVVEC